MQVHSNLTNKSIGRKIPAALVNERINKLKAHIETSEKTAVGQKYIDFSMQTPEGETVSLSDFVSKNKYTLIDFGLAGADLAVKKCLML